MTDMEELLFKCYLQHSCNIFGVSIEELFVKPMRSLNKVRAKCHFVRSIVTMHETTSHTKLSEFLQQSDHTSITYYLYDCKAEINLPPLKRPFRHPNYQLDAA